MFILAAVYIVCVHGLLSQFFCLWCACFKILGGFMKWAIFQVVGSLLYAHYPIVFSLLFEQHYQVLFCVKIKEKV